MWGAAVQRPAETARCSALWVGGRSSRTAFANCTTHLPATTASATFTFARFHRAVSFTRHRFIISQRKRSRFPRTLACPSAAASSFPSRFDDGSHTEVPPLLQAPIEDVGEESLRSLPAPPASASLVDVLPYLWRLALHDRSLRWRLALSLTLLCVAKSTGLAVPVLFSRAVDSLSTGAPMLAVLQILIISGACKAISGAASEARSVSFTPVAQAAGRKIAVSLFAHVLALDLHFHTAHKTGALNRTIDRGTRSVTMVFRAVVFTFLPTAVELLLVGGVLWHSFHPSLVLSVAATFAAYTWWTVTLAKVAAERRKEQNRLDSLASGAAVDTLLNTESIQNFDNAKLRCNQYNDLLADHQRAQQRSEQISCLLNAGQAIILAAGVMSVLCMTVLWGKAGAGDLVLVNGLLLQLWAPLQFLGFFYRELRQSLVDIDAMLEVFATKSRVEDGAEGLPAGQGGVAVRLRDVHFGYSERRPVLQGVSLEVRAGERLAVVGPSGSGKSTLLRLLLRMYDPQQGSVEVDGVDVRRLRLSALRAATAVVPQDTAMFNDTILNNIAFGRPGATRAEVEACAEAAQLGDAVRSMPDGFDTVVGERGVKLSGGERQRVAIARALVRDPRLVLCDEATSALDSVTEEGIRASLCQLASGRTSITVAHRLSTVADADRIIVLRAGRIVEDGSHSDLLRREGLYASMWRLQEKDQGPPRPGPLAQPVPAPVAGNGANGANGVAGAASASN